MNDHVRLLRQHEMEREVIPEVCRAECEMKAVVAAILILARIAVQRETMAPALLQMGVQISNCQYHTSGEGRRNMCPVSLKNVPGSAKIAEVKRLDHELRS
jgi:hypothetical protein